EEEHFGALVQYSLRPLTDVEVERISRRRERIGPVDPSVLVPIGARALRRRLQEFVEGGFSKFVVLPVGQPDGGEGGAGMGAAERVSRRGEGIGAVGPSVLVPIGARALRRRLQEFVEVGFSKFVVLPVSQPDVWEDELGMVAQEVLPLQTAV